MGEEGGEKKSQFAVSPSVVAQERLALSQGDRPA